MLQRVIKSLPPLSHKSLLVFTDLDGTLLDHHSYAFDAALPALSRIAALQIPLIINSSKTAAEIEQLRSALKNSHPYIVENGGATLWPDDYLPLRKEGESPSGNEPCSSMIVSYQQIISQIHPLRSISGYRFKGFADLSSTELARLTGLSREEASLAQQREASEPILWHDSEEALQSFKSDLADLGLKLLKGGRFFHVMGKTDKAVGMSKLLHHYQQAWPDRNWQTVALGDGENDRGMLEVADVAIVIPSASGEALHLQRNTQVIIADQPGPVGWNQTMTALLDRIDDQGA